LLKIQKYVVVFTIFICYVVIALAYSHEIRYALSSDSSSVISPSDHISDKEIRVFSDKVVIDKENIKWAKIKDTHSMEPVLNVNSISLEVMPLSSDEIEVGDIISYEQDSIFIIHRVINIGEDASGWFAVTKGDNNEEADPYKIRFSQVKGIVVGVLY